MIQTIDEKPVVSEFYSQPVVSAYYAQHGQDKYILSLFENSPMDKSTHFFVDIGAHDGKTLSNTFALESAGWQGLCIEALPEPFQLLARQRTCQCVNTAISNFNGTKKFLSITGYAEMLSGFINTYETRHLDRIYREIAHHGGSMRILNIPTQTLGFLLDKYQVEKIDYLSIDTEGSELEILEGIDWSCVNIDVIGVEVNYPETQGKAIASFLNTKEYTHIATIGGDWFFRKNINIKN